MASAVDASAGIVGYLALFGGIGFAFVFANLLLGRFLRPKDPHPEKQEIYECGEPAIGSSYVQFDLRFYVVALIFIIFDVEVAFLFPWATVFGKSTNLLEHKAPMVQQLDDGQLAYTEATAGVLRELGVANPIPLTGDIRQAERDVESGFQQLAFIALIEASVFFVILLIGFAYEWKLGALDWVRSMVSQKEAMVKPIHPGSPGGPSESVLSA
ncbi:MAG: NADH-quinone oxidoreductase subunit A [Planctomycetales bacterium]|nr:NADH-quinone oxidoreductase subunit A [Planctomycetales bacterium]